MPQGDEISPGKPWKIIPWSYQEQLCFHPVKVTPEQAVEWVKKLQVEGYSSHSKASFFHPHRNPRYTTKKGGRKCITLFIAFAVEASYWFV